MTLPDATDIPPATWGGKRTPKPGNKIGAPKKPVEAKAHAMTITLSCKAAGDNLRAKAKLAGKTPGALVEAKLKLSQKKRS